MQNCHLTRFLILAVCLGLTACAMVGPKYTAPEPDLPEAWNQLEQTDHPVADDAQAGDVSRWWRQLDDPLLAGLMDEALQAGPDLRLAQARLREARARRGVAGAGRFPEAAVSGSYRRSQSSEEAGSGRTNDLFSAGLDASWEIDIFGGVRRRVAAAEADVAAAVAELGATSVSLTAEVALNYVEVRGLQLRLAIARANLASQTETLQLTEWREQAGLVGRQDVEQARTNRELTRAQIPSLETSLVEAEHRLDILLGTAPGTVHARLAAVRDLPVMPVRIAVGIPADTLRQRPDIRAAERRLAAETARVGAAEAARYPAFNLSGSIGLEALEAENLATSGAVASSLLAGITAPIFDAGRLRQQVEIQDAVREQAEVAYEQTVLAALQDVENALVAIKRHSERGGALAGAAAAARNAAQLARQQYSAGLIDFQTVLDTERTVLTVEDSLAGTRTDGLLALISLYKALGGGWTPQGESRQAGKDTP
ncbi:NodT family efflux transporter outer membrane factor (OMF) lipoprotein [Desulfoprunum benzoelyticum]|uniref:NodT family efflux transporter outer membrane factor (OMF) lipoprotein n=1 Tax=Desulfoprunum benzoelyticum TaxID=1506996 RepID=A0A840UXE4_9BACT|nr:efflux transporter outer membrane subunit [Desulfoprunum benzoelyticum]MBB5349603.1 NodT family efflux transporter outer membrane factor (OMF) lipoprotein [Desulfoprunum benzoelyticum]